jgi:hypothetical protein
MCAIFEPWWLLDIELTINITIQVGRFHIQLSQL